MIQSVLILGGGSAGLLAAITLKTLVPALRVGLVRSKDLGVIGVGEGTTALLPIFLHDVLRIDRTEFYRIAQPLWKFGIRFTNWGPRPYFDYTFRQQLNYHFDKLLPRRNAYYCDERFEYADLPSALMTHDRVFLRHAVDGLQIGKDFGYHIENQKLVTFLETYAAGLGVTLGDEMVEAVQQDDHGITGLVLQSGRTATADLYIDASGFASVLLAQALREPYHRFTSTLFCDRAVVGGWDRTDEPIKPYTTGEGMEAGWCWQIEHEGRINRGYVFASAFIADDAAEQEFRHKNPKVGATRVVKFRSGRYARAWVQNVVGIGNAYGFVEPLEATSLAHIALEAYRLAQCLLDCGGQAAPSLIRAFNQQCGQSWEDIRDFLSVHYKFNTHFETPFWRECRAKVDLAGAAPLVEYFQENGPLTWGIPLDATNLFDLEAYWCLLIGQKVPTQRTYTPSPAERAAWQRIQDDFKAQALTAVSIPEALAIIRSPQHRWGSLPPLVMTPDGRGVYRSGASPR